MQTGLGVVVLPREAEWGVRRTVRRPGRCAPECAARAPGDLALFVYEFGRGADQVRDDGEEAGVDFVLGGIGRRDAFRLGDRVQALQLRPPRHTGRAATIIQSPSGNDARNASTSRFS